MIRVVDIRRRRSGSSHQQNGNQDGQQPKRTYSVRWVVRGHWRLQPCGPGRTPRRLVFINPYLTGPENAPLKVEPSDVVKVLR